MSVHQESVTRDEGPIPIFTVVTPDVLSGLKTIALRVPLDILVTKCGSAWNSFSMLQLDSVIKTWMEGTPIAARPPAHREDEDSQDLRLGRATPVNTIKAANFAHLNDLSLLHLVLRRHYVPISCQETQEFTISIASFSRCFCEDVQCSLKFFFIMDCQVNFLVVLSLLVSIGQAIGSCFYASTSAMDLRTETTDL
eukprot:s161_g9.t1